MLEGDQKESKDDEKGKEEIVTSRGKVEMKYGNDETFCTTGFNGNKKVRKR